MAMNVQGMNINCNKPTKGVSFTAGQSLTPEQLRAKQDEFQKMAEQMSQVVGKKGDGDKPGFFDKIGKAIPKVFAVVIAFTAMKLCLGKAADMVTGGMNKTADKFLDKATQKATEKATEKATQNLDKLKKVVDKIRQSKADKYIVNVIAGGAAAGVALQQFGLVKKDVSEDTKNLIDTSVNSTQGSSYDYNNDIDEEDF